MTRKRGRGNRNGRGNGRANARGGARGGARGRGPNGNLSEMGNVEGPNGPASLSNGLMIPILTKKKLPEQYCRKNPVGSGSGVRGSNILKALSSDYYLHKKFKKLTATLEDEESLLVKEGSSSTNHNNNNEVNGGVRSDSEPKEVVGKEDVKDLTAKKKPADNEETISASGGSNGKLKIGQEIRVNGGWSSDGAVDSRRLVDGDKTRNFSGASANDGSTGSRSECNEDQGSPSKMLYRKPKFRISPEEIAAAATTSAEDLAQEVGERERRLNGENHHQLRLDRKSLDDHISKLIDENQSLLSWPEHLKKRLKTQVQKGQTTNGAGGSGTLSRSNSLLLNQSEAFMGLPEVVSNGAHRQFRQTGGVLQVASNSLLMPRSHLEEETGLNLKKQLSSPRDRMQQVPLTASHGYHSGGAVDVNMSPPLGSNGELNLTVVPKKRRRMSPTPNRLCGGEVSELPVHTSAPAINGRNGAFQDVDVNLRVSNTSGAKVTIRTSPSALNNIGLGYNSLIHSPMDDLLRQRSAGLDYRADQGLLAKAGEAHASKNDDRSRGQRKSREELGRSYPKGMNGVIERDQPVLAGSSLKSGDVKVDVSNVKVEPCEEALTMDDDNNKTNIRLEAPPPKNPKRPNFLAIKPPSLELKKQQNDVLPSPETPRIAKTYNQMHINGNAYTSLGFKVSTRSSYTCLFKPQPMFIPQETDPKLSMYSNWQPRPRNKSQEEIAISTNDSRVNGRLRNMLYTSAGSKCDTETVKSPVVDKLSPMWSFGDLSPSTPNGKPFPPSRALSSPSATKVSNSAADTILTSSSALIAPALSAVPSQGSSVPREPVVKPSAPSIAAGPSTSYLQCLSDISSDEGEEDYSTAATIPVTSSSIDRVRKFSENRGPFIIEDDGIKRDYEPGDQKAKSVSTLSNTNSSGDDIEDERSSSSVAYPRIKIMEGGFESNEDYTYVRGRGRGRYVCEACGIRCKKPSMLRKHLKTHTDLRPYTCKLCNFSFKTKGNLTKHQKSKSHHKKCLGLGIHPESSQSLEMTGPTFSDDDSDDDDGNDSDSQEDIDVDDVSSCTETGTESTSAPEQKTEEGTPSFEKEIAQSLLDLSKISRVGSDVDSQSTCSLPSHSPVPSQPDGDTVMSHKKFGNRSAIAAPTDECNIVKPNCPPAQPEIPMDLSCRQGLKRDMEHESCPEAKRSKFERNGMVRPFGIVGEASHWEPMQQMPPGSMHLTRMPNEFPPKPSNDFKVGQGLSSGASEQVDVKPSVNALDFSHMIKFPPNGITQSTTLGIGGKPVMEVRPCLSGGPSPSAASQHQLGQPPPPKPQKLHQPWLSPSPPVLNEPETPEAKRVSCTVPSSMINHSHNGHALDATERKVFDRPAEYQQDASVVQGMFSPREGKTGSQHLTSPNSKLFGLGNSMKPQAEFRPPSGAQALVKDEGKAECNVCGKGFARASQLTLHMNIHYLERPHRCDPCGVSFRTKGHLIKHKRSSGHESKAKVHSNESWGVASEENPRPFKCVDCKIAFRIHGHLAKHLRSKMHILRMECLGKLPFGIYFEMEKSGLNLTEIDTSDCDMSLVSLQAVAKKIYGDSWTDRLQPSEEQAS